jgi:cell filamentation protein
MTESVYGSIKDPYCYKRSAVLKNKLSIRVQSELNEAERRLTSLRFEQPLPHGKFDVSHYCSIHQYLFQDIFAWAGQFRTIRISKGNSMFCYPEFIATEMENLFAQLHSSILGATIDRRGFAIKAANFLSDLNAIHPFREGNGRTQLAFLTVLSEQAGHPLNLKTFNPERLLTAMIASFDGDAEDLAAEINGDIH